VAIDRATLHATIIAFADELARTEPGEISTTQPRPARRGRPPVTKRKVLIDGMIAAADMLRDAEPAGE
jgi:hypothetical protein